MEELVHQEVKNQIAWVTLQRPNKLNALSKELVDQLYDQLVIAEENPEVKVIVIKGSGKSFCAGGDIESMSQIESTVDAAKWIDSVSQLTTTIRTIKKYVVAAVNGYAAGAGFSLALACDFIVADRDAKFAISFTNIGLIPDLGLMKSLSSRISMPLLKEWVSKGAIISAKDAQNYSVINKVVDELDEGVEQFVSFIIHGPSVANRYVKEIINSLYEQSFEEVREKENVTQALLLQTTDHEEGVQAFIEKRSPKFKGR
ncbi:enoyl-CoA hydratase/isomerase family protein [Halalkalibacillus halophilus]|uniref:enoyl-CoA hydratase/isomerase family protein n=1 Tax=Halalkalibacillus halophilus TaxID=392827 RepID=UPI0006844B27|nr:enoyl-CoA hydratase/isomerase family protein [Halalkalibacillus halophilus]